MKRIDFEINNGSKNMQIDSDMLNFAIENNIKEPIIRFYGWTPACISLGRNQNDTFLDKDFLKSKNIDVVRRLTGGRALLHDKEITYCYICPTNSIKNGKSVVGSYKEISQFLIDGFNNLGIKLDFPDNKQPHTKFNYCMCISTSADLSFEGKKLIGSAQLRKEGYILQHGSINFEYNKNLIWHIFNEKIDKASTTCLKEINPSIIYEDVINSLNIALVDKDLVI